MTLMEGWLVGFSLETLMELLLSLEILTWATLKSFVKERSEGIFWEMLSEFDT